MPGMPGATSVAMPKNTFSTLANASLELVTGGDGPSTVGEADPYPDPFVNAKNDPIMKRALEYVIPDDVRAKMPPYRVNE